MMTKEALANELLKQGWVLLPPPGCVVRVKRACDQGPREFKIDEIEIEIEMGFSLWQHGEAEDDEYELCYPEDIIEFISTPEEWYDPDLWWRHVRNEDRP